MLPSGVTVLEHGKGAGVTETYKDENFGKEAGTLRTNEFELAPKTGYQCHVHPKMHERFIVIEGVLSVWFFNAPKVVGGQPIFAERHELTTGQSLFIRAETLHFVFNNGDVRCKVQALQTIVEPGGKTLIYDLQ